MHTFMARNRTIVIGVAVRVTGRRVIAGAVLLVLLAGTSHARQLSPKGWTFSEIDSAQRLGPEMADNDLRTAWVSCAPLAPGSGVVIDLGQEVVVHRLFFAPGKSQGGTPRRFRVVFSDGQADHAPAATLDVELPAGRSDVNLFFDPVVARHIRLEAVAPSEQPWSIAELEAYGSDDPAARRSQDAVVVDIHAPGPLRMAAEDLRYYIGELTGRPLPVVAPDRTDAFRGTLYRIVDLKPLAATWEAMEANRRSGKIPATEVNVERAGRQVLFQAFPYANVRFSVWAFLERQGVRWLYPDDHGDWVPAGQGVDLTCLPLHYAPSSARRYANFEMAEKSASETNDPACLFWWRNGYNSTWGSAQRLALGGAEVPPSPHGFLPYTQWKDEYKEGFDGYPHNFASVLPDRIIDRHPDWWGSINGKRVPPFRGGPAVCMTSPGLIQFVVDKAIGITAGPESTAVLSLLPMDDARFCECPRCQALCEPREKPAVPWVAYPTLMASDAYYYFVAEVAKGIRAARPKVRIQALAYANVHSPPRKIDRLPDNVLVEVCQYGAPDLPMSSPANAAMKACIEQWHRRCGRLEHYDYALLNENRESFVMPLPLVTAMADHARYLHGLEALGGGTQADRGGVPYSPWNHYAYPRLLWNSQRAADELLEEFFAGYFREAKQPMLAYYRTLEEHLIRNDVSLHQQGNYQYGVTPGSFSYAVLVALRRHLEQAEKASAAWVVAQRVARIREGFEWVLKESCLTAADLESPARFPRIPADGKPATIVPSMVRVRKFFVEPHKDGGWVFWAHGMLAADLRLDKPGSYVVSVTAKGVPCDNVDPVLNVYLDHCRAGSVAISSKDFKEYEFHIDHVSAGVNRLLLSYWNAASGGRRNVYVKEIRVGSR